MELFIKRKQNILIFCALCFAFFSCKEETSLVPKPRMYPRIMWPERQDTAFSHQFCAFSFKYPSYFEFSKDTMYFEQKPKHPCWFNLHSSALNATLYCSYTPISNIDPFDSLRKDAFEIAEKHNARAEYRKESIIEKGQDLKGIVFEIDGPVASPYQFYISDEKQHFMRASLYINAKVNPDSTKVIFDFLKSDVAKMIESFEWKKK